MRWRNTASFWESAGERNPFGVILTGADRAPRDWNVAEFFETGVRDVNRLMAELEGIAPQLLRRSALDFGCGVGRITRALSSHFNTALGIDVARSMVAAARRLNATSDRCEFRANRSSRLRGIASNRFDLVYSRLVLQHIPPPSVRRYIPEFVRVLAPRGVLMFQLPEPLESDPDWLYRSERQAFVDAPIVTAGLKSIAPRWLVRAYRQLRFRRLVPRPAPAQRMYVFGMRREDVVRLIERAHARILRIDADQSHGDDVPGWSYWVTKDTA